MGNLKRGVVLVLGIWWILLGGAWAGDVPLDQVGQIDPLVQILLQAEADGKPIPVLSLLCPQMDETMAYGVQKLYVNEKLGTTRIEGFKGGLTSRPSQKRFGLTAPVAGVLFGSGKLISPAVVGSSRFHHLMIETEIGYVVGCRLTRPLKNIAELKACVSEMLPVIELPDLGFDQMKDLKGVDIIAANVSARQFIVGHGTSIPSMDPNTLGVTLSQNGDEVNKGTGTDALGDQWEAAFWLMNKVLAQGWTLEPGQVIITGALGRMIPGKPGKYVADYGPLGSVLFEIR
jgi:2-keto-4-pentenoate hydratase